jgi:hypothetical protein
MTHIYGVFLVDTEGPHTRFSAACNDSLTTRCGDRRLKSAKARSRVVLGTDWQRRYVDCDTSVELVCGREVDTPNGSATRLVD